MSAPTTETGLRERKKAATRQALHDASLRLALEHGPEKVTVEAIADEAGVSRRTFSNYFANKEEALFYGDYQRMRLLAGMLHARPADEAPWTALTAAAKEFYDQLGDLDPEWISRRRLIRRHPSLASPQMQVFAVLEQEISAEVTLRVGQTADPLGVRAKLLTATFLAALRIALNAWLEHPAGTHHWTLAADLLAQAGRGFAD
ncbi:MULTISPECIES: TetR/AcrR family transcriptional regulator [Actinoplanes]|uniref:TetR/AcrR family transcriptional regulator n=1 Tax=Actinoplanes TaxID=1865 RepID=UPI0005F2A47F|nr:MULTISPECIES: TetR/AcrR family transcriptional regulator [Actinoplanes]GLY05138.1 TetR family transcriptional regulator [Actinoplanes sp. NBRC 101535]